MKQNRNKLSIYLVSLLTLWFVPLCAIAIPSPMIPSPAIPISQPAAIRSGSPVPILNFGFIENRGQAPKSVQFYRKTREATISVTEEGISYALTGAAPNNFTERFVARGKPIAATGDEHLLTTVNFFKGSETQWRGDVPTFSELHLGEVWPGIEVALQASGKSAEKIFTVKPNAQVDSIRIAVESDAKPELAADGRLRLMTGGRTVEFSKPIAYQTRDGKRQEISVTYALSGSSYGFRVGEYDRSVPLVIDPVVSSTYLGGNQLEYFVDIALTASGEVLVLGVTGSADFPLAGTPYQTTSSNLDIVVARFSSDLSTLIAATYLGGAAADDPVGLAVATDGSVYVAGRTTGADFPVTFGAYDTSQNGSTDIVVSKLSASLSTLVASTFVGGVSSDVANDMAIDSSGRIFVVGTSTSADFPTTAGAYSTSPLSALDGVVFALGSNLDVLISSTFIGGTDIENPFTLAFTSSGTLIVVGDTRSSDFPVSLSALDTTFNGGVDGFISNFSADLSTLLASTFIGGNGEDLLKAVVIDGSGNLIVAGRSTSADFPVTGGAHDASLSGTSDLVVAKVRSDLTTLTAATFFGGTGTETITDTFRYGMALDSSGIVYLVGDTTSSDLQTTAGSFDQSFNGGGSDIMIARFSSDLLTLHAATYIGGTGADSGTAITIGSGGFVYIAGGSSSTDYPVSSSAFQGTFDAVADGVVTVLPLSLAATEAPSVVTVTSANPNGDYEAGSVITITVEFNEAVTVATAGGVPQLALNSGGVATYSSGTGSDTLLFTYTVQAGESAADLDYTSSSALSVNGGTITGAASSIAASLTLPNPGAAGSLGANKNLNINGAASVRVPLDFDGDGLTDLATTRASSSRRVIRWVSSADASVNTCQFRITGSRNVSADYDGDGKSECGVISRGENRSVLWSLINDESGVTETEVFGLRGDQVLAGCSFNSTVETEMAYVRGAELTYKSFGDPATTVVTLPSRARASQLLGCGDVDGDGVDELFFRVRRSQDRYSILAVNVSGETIFTLRTKSGVLRGFTADLNGDLVPELVLERRLSKTSRRQSFYSTTELRSVRSRRVNNALPYSNGICSGAEGNEACLIERRGRRGVRRVLLETRSSRSAGPIPSGHQLVPSSSVIAAP